MTSWHGLTYWEVVKIRHWYRHNDTQSSQSRSPSRTVYLNSWVLPIIALQFMLLASCRLASNDSFTVPLHSPNGRHLPAVRAAERNCHWGLKNGGNSHWSRKPIMQWGTSQSQSIFRLTNHKSVMPANRKPCRIPHWQSYCHHARTV